MQWTPEHAQWAEQHFDITSTTRSPAHKAEAYRGHLQRTYQYAWANDDISALTASNLLKKYAEKYSGILEGPSERALLSSYSDGPPGLLNGRKSEGEPWQEAVYPMNCLPDVISTSKAGVVSGLPTADISASMGSSPGVEPSYSSSNSGGLHSGLPAQEYVASYNGSYLQSSYSGQPTSALPSPHPSPLHSAGLLQPPAPPPSTNPGARLQHWVSQPLKLQLPPCRVSPRLPWLLDTALVELPLHLPTYHQELPPPRPYLPPPSLATLTNRITLHQLHQHL
ncbi:hypothetical protein AAFF_G00189030 [Aldrovandia affinis]|uniref:Uncharacterized protein n=1 Tax=Aldrovandia affinis TaxID=143900 RepID=A0AAD7W5X6_9TELE|nr:hypothetical protein AAFF_G00189030 [Aldrovandia affinis]